MMRKNNPVRVIIKIKIFVVVLLLCVWNGMNSPEEVQAADAKAVTTQIPVSCIAEGMQDTFCYYLEGDESGAERVEATKIYLRDGEKGVFVISYLEPGTYHYLVHQESGTDSKAIYDNTIYNVDVYVTAEENGTLSADPIIYKEGSTQKKAELEFINSKEKLMDSGKNDRPKTGDQGNTKGLIILMTVSALGIIRCLNMKRRRSSDAERRTYR